MNNGGVQLVFLGTGTSHGIPMIGCDCAVCRSDDPRDRRNRASAALRLPDGRAILIDTAPELRLSAVACRLRRVDAVLFTHAHADHITGLDDIRRFNDVIRDTIPCYANEVTIQRVRQCFSYAETPYRPSGDTYYRPAVSFHVLDRPTDIRGLTVTPIPLLHGRDPVLGFRFGNTAYCTDVSAIPEASWKLLEGLDLLVLDALRHAPHPTHFNLAQALEVVGRLKPERALFTHITHELSHAATNARLPENVQLAYDGQVVRLT